MVIEIYHVMLIYNGSIQKCCIHALKYIYNYSFKEDELKGMPILVRYFVVAFIAIATW
jgi:hypothetical protein